MQNFTARACWDDKKLCYDYGKIIQIKLYIDKT